MNSVTMIILLLFGMWMGYLLRHYRALARQGNAEIQADKIRLRANEDAQEITLAAQEKAEKILEEARDFQREKEREIKEFQMRIAKREEMLDKRALDLDGEYEKIKVQMQEVEALRVRADELVVERTDELHRIAGITSESAYSEIVARIERESAEDLERRIAKLERDGQERLQKRAQDILATVIQRLATPTTSELTTTTVTLPSEDIKGKIIGKEGRNIRTFEKESGVELVVDDTPGTITISSFDPVRRQIARVALENLILDGRIQPAKIEEFLQKARDEINKIIKDRGEAAAYEVGVYNLDPRIIAIVGRLHFRTSYGQNVLSHSIEMAHVAGMLAQELGADPLIAKAGALVHDIGKALDHEFPGTHIEIGIRILEKFGADPRIITAMKSHHDDWPHETIEAVIVQVADMISGGRPGARRDTLENYIKRLRELETLAGNFAGVEKAYALSAGREIRVFVRPDERNDLAARTLARDIANAIESELRFPGEIKVTVIRENRIIEFAR